MVSLQAWLTEAQRWWQGLTTSVQEALIIAAAAVSALIIGKVVGVVVKSLSKSFGLDELMKLPWSQTSSHTGKTLSDAIGYLCVATVWAGFVWYLSFRHQLTDIANATRLVVGRIWMLAVMMGLGIGLSNWLIKLLLNFLRSQTVREVTGKFLPQGHDHFSDMVVKAFTFLAYCFWFLLVLAIVADLFGMMTTASVIKSLWELSLRLIIAAIALGIGWLGVRWVEKGIGSVEVKPAPSELVYYLTRLSIIGIALLLSLILLTGGASVLVALLIVAILAFLLAPLREYVPDLWSGWMLRLHNVRQVEVNSKLMKLERVGILASELRADDTEAVNVVKNREILQAFLEQGSLKESAS